MAGFHTKTFQKHDDYMTPQYAWENIKDFIPKDKMIYEPFYGNGDSGKHFESMGFKVYHKNEDFYEHSEQVVKENNCTIVSNPPFSDTARVLAHLKKLDNPFILIMPSSKINTQYFRKLFAEDPNPVQIIIPRKRINFLKLIDGKVPEGWKDACNFDCFYYCWKMNLPRDIIWLE